MTDRVIDITVGVGFEAGPYRVLALKRHAATLPGLFQQIRDDCVLANVLCDIFLGVVRAHLTLVDVLLKDITENIRIDLVAGCKRAVIKVPIVAIKERKETDESFVGYFNFLAMLVFNFMLIEEAAI